jgi:glycosyltransferase involved in cell wall biosynthesis
LPALHDEPFARLDVYRYQMRNVRGLWFETQPEMALARSLDLIGDGFELVGSAVDIPHGIDIEGFRNKFGIDGDYLFYAGRREWGKGWPALLDDLAFADEVLGKSLPLVTCGIGEVGPLPPRATVIDLGRISDPDRASGQAGASAYIQPSALEAFSRTVVEALSLGTPVVANWHSAVVRWHCERSGGGLTYKNRYEFTECVRIVRDEPEIMAEIGRSGPAYVREHFNWPAVLDRAERTIGEWF